MLFYSIKIRQIMTLIILWIWLWFLIIFFSEISLWKKMFFWIIFSLQTWIFLMSNIFTWEWVNESIIYHLQNWIAGAWIWSDKKIVIISFFLCFIFLLWIFLSAINKKYTLKNHLFISYVWISIGIIFHPFNFNMYNLFIPEKIQKENISLHINDYYKNIDIIWAWNGKNIVYLYLESFENLYLNENIFPGLAPNLQQLAKKSTQFLWLKQTFWTQWTIAWIVSSQCGLPLTVSSEKSGNIYKNSKCLWDILKQKKYSTYYIWGAQWEFWGKKQFLSQHGYDTILGKNEFLQQWLPKDNMYDWGLYDDIFFNIFTEKFLELSKTQKKFLLTWLTLDTHGKFWVISKKCKNLAYKHSLKILQSYHCTDFLVGEFFKKIQSSPYFWNTIFIISSDHYAMNHNQSIPILQQHEEKREHLFLIYEPWKAPGKIRKNWTSFDKFPTVLYALWFDIDNAGLWVNLWSWENTLQEIFWNTKNILIYWRNKYKDL